jgi:hypothetical protein
MAICVETFYNITTAEKGETAEDAYRNFENKVFSNIRNT